MREAREETGLQTLQLHPAAPAPLDVDVHEIPARPASPPTRTLDLRYLVVAGAGALIRAREEAADLRWFAGTSSPRSGSTPGCGGGLSKPWRYIE